MWSTNKGMDFKTRGRIFEAVEQVFTEYLETNVRNKIKISQKN